MVVQRGVGGGRWCLVALALGCLACTPEPDDATPEGALRLFLEAMERSEWDAEAREEAYRLLGSETRARLRTRARRAEGLARRELAPWDVLVQGSFRLRFTPNDAATKVATTEGDRATVVVRGRGEGQRAEVPMVRERGKWRVALRLPPLSSP
ncbi:MAG: hypothetical protein ACODAU_10275 [Myxococcota bacterium]